MLNVTAILDRFESAVTDNTDELRARALIWLNIILKRVSNERDWTFLQKSATSLAITSGVIALPADCNKVLFIADTAGSWFLTNTEKLSHQEVFRLNSTNAETPTGYSISGGTLILHPSGTTATTCNLIYTQTVPDYTDTTADTLYPDESSTLIHRVLMTSFYEYDFDERMPMAAQLAAAEMIAFKDWDNRQKPITQYFTATTVTNYAP